MWLSWLRQVFVISQPLKKKSENIPQLVSTGEETLSNVTFHFQDLVFHVM